MTPPVSHRHFCRHPFCGFLLRKSQKSDGGDGSFGLLQYPQRQLVGNHSGDGSSFFASSPVSGLAGAEICEGVGGDDIALSVRIAAPAARSFSHSQIFMKFSIPWSVSPISVLISNTALASQVRVASSRSATVRVSSPRAHQCIAPTPRHPCLTGRPHGSCRKASTWRKHFVRCQ